MDRRRQGSEQVQRNISPREYHRLRTTTHSTHKHTQNDIRQTTLYASTPNLSPQARLTISLPDAADAESALKPAELAVLRSQYEKEDPYPSLQTKFNYAWGLIKSNKRDEQQLGVQLLSDIFRQSPDRRRECLYYLALGHYKLGNYAEARRYNDSLLELEEGNLQAQSLKDLIEDKVQKEGLFGVAIVGGLAVAAGIVGGLLVRGAQRKR